MTESKLTVPEMSCDACRTAIEGALEGVPGVASVSVDLERKLVAVEHDELRAPVARLAAAIEDQGYEIKGSREG
jgi:copper chaperone CopZ